MFTHTRFADFRSPAWERWREAEKASDEIFRYCRDCGFVHRRGNHAPMRDNEKQPKREGVLQR